MKNKITLFSILISLLFNVSLTAQIYTGTNAAGIIPNAAKIWLNEKDGTLKFVRFNTPQPFDRTNPASFIENMVNSEKRITFHLEDVQRDNIGMTHYRFVQVVNGIPVEYRKYYLHTDGNGVRSMNGQYADVPFGTGFPVVSEPLAFQIAKNAVPGELYEWEDLGTTRPAGEKRYFIKNGKGHLAYKIDIYSLQPLARYWVYVDAISGEILFKENRIQEYTVTGTAYTKYHGTQSILTDSVSSTQYLLRDSLTGIYTFNLNNSTWTSSAVDFTDSDNIWNTTTNQDDAALDAHWGAKKTYDYFLNTFGRDSYDGNGSSIRSYVHYGNNVVNAFWNGSFMTYGDGNGTSYSALTSIDIVGHELAHGVTQYSAGLIYSYESGALNESFSDIFGVVVDFYADPANANWLMGDVINITGNGFRNMSNPNAKYHPDTYLGNYWYTGSGDNGGVHYNSGVQNYWFYLLTSGGTGTNDNGDAYNVTGIGMADAAAIAYRNLTVYLTPNSQYADARFYAIEAAIDLFGFCSMQEKSTTDAWYAVGIGAPFMGTQAAFNAIPGTACNTPATITFLNLSNHDTAWLWDFGDGTTSTLENPTHTYTSTGSYTVQLKAYGYSSCTPGIDSTTLTVTVNNSGEPKAPYCAPNSTTTDADYGILSVVMGNINNVTQGAPDDYMDYSCEFRDTFEIGQYVPFTITTGNGHNEYLYIFLDMDTNGAFSLGELVHSSYGNVHTGSFLLPGGAVLNTPLRLRIISNFSPLTNFCNSIPLGQAEDYSLYLLPVSQAPAADFMADNTTILVGSTVNFTDMSTALPTSYSWSFTGGTPLSSSWPNPSVTYNTIGTYPVSLTVSNSFGSDTETKTGYIQVVSSINMCTATSTTAPSGTLFDSGGNSGNYSNNETCTFLIQPSCADTIALSFSFFSVENGWDFLEVYDGVDENGTLLLNATGYSIPSTVYATSGAMFIKFISDYIITTAGFEANWTTVLHNSGPVTAVMNISDNNPPFLGEITFSDASTGSVTDLLWDLGDGTSNSNDTFYYTYLSPGTFPVSLIASNCNYSDTAYDTVIVQDLPTVTVPAIVRDTMYSCLDSIVIPVTIGNNGSGDLTIDLAHGTRKTHSDTSLNVYSNTGDSTISTFYVNPERKGNLNLTINLDGDFDQTWEWVDIYLDDVFIDQVNPNSFTSQHQYIIGYEFANYLLADDSIHVKIVNSYGVNIFTQLGNYHEVILSYKYEYFLFTPIVMDTVSVGGTTQIDVVVYDTAGLAPGLHYDTVAIYTNDTANSPILIPVEIWNETTPELDISTNCLTFDTIVPGGTAVLPVVLSNLNCELLDISSISNNNTVFSLNMSNLTIDSIGSDTLWVTASSTVPLGWVYDTINIQTNDIDTTVCLSVFIDNLPDAALVPDTIEFEMKVCAMGTATGNFSLSNSGYGDLTWSAATSSSSVVLSSSSGTVPVGGNDTVSVSVTGNGVPGLYWFFVTVNTNDPDNPQMIVQLKLTLLDDPCVAFAGSEISSCDRAVYFDNTTTGNAVSYLWDFGDGNTSTATTPVHNYSASGTYTVTLIACGSTLCDTTIQTITVTGSGSSVTQAACYPLSINPTGSTGIDSVLLGSLQSGTGPSTEGYLDNSCTQGTQIYAGLANTITVKSHPGTMEIVKAWIDYNDDGQFDPSELILDATAMEVHTATFTPPASAVLNTPLRMRVLSDTSGASVAGACHQPGDGQAEDYYVELLPSLPAAGFATSAIDICNGEFQFTDQTTNNPTSWDWDFGDGNSSTLQNPAHTYSTSGTYTVTLTATNVFGSDTTTQTVDIQFVTASFTFSGSMMPNQPVQFNGSGNNANSWSWDFDDGNTSNVQNPSHSYTASGTYFVELVTSDSNGCTAQFTDTVVILSTGIAGLDNAVSYKLYPNPAQDVFFLEYSGEPGNLSLTLLDGVGKQVFFRKLIVSENTVIPFEETFAPGVYYLKLDINGHSDVMRLVIK